MNPAKTWRPAGGRRLMRTRCSAETPRPNRRGDSTPEFTPFTLMRYATDPVHFCKHKADVVVDASPEHCFEIWNKWENLVDFLDLIGEIVPDPVDPNLALLICYYRYGDWPILQIATHVEKKEILSPTLIQFDGTLGMPLRGKVEFESVGSSQTRVELRFEHAMPSGLLTVGIGVYGVQNHLKLILEENMATFKLLAEGKLPFSEEKYDRERAVREIEELREAYVRSGWLSIDEPYQPTDIDDYSRPVSEFEMFPDGLE